MQSAPLRGVLAGLAGGLAWNVALLIFFLPAQFLLQDPQRQSAKFLAAFAAQPLPRMAEAPWIVPAGLAAIGALWGLVYVWVSGGWSGAWWRKGICFGALAWALMVPWFEFYLPWNVMREPLPLVLLEAACWAGVLVLVGLAIAGTDAFLRRGARPA